MSLLRHFTLPRPVYGSSFWTSKDADETSHSPLCLGPTSGKQWIITSRSTDFIMLFTGPPCLSRPSPSMISEKYYSSSVGRVRDESSPWMWAVKSVKFGVKVDSHRSRKILQTRRVSREVRQVLTLDDNACTISIMNSEQREANLTQGHIAVAHDSIVFARWR